MGIIFAIIALLSWGIGDFLIQKSTRKLSEFHLKDLFIYKSKRRFGNLIVLFCITLTGAVVLSPFIYQELKELLVNGNFYQWLILLLAGSVMLFAAIFDFRALKTGKISVIEPVLTWEIPVTVLLSAIIIKEFLSFNQIVLVAAIFLGIILVSVTSFQALRQHKLKLEAGVVAAFLATLAMGSANFLVGLGARELSPLMINWFINIFITLAILLYLLYQSKSQIIFHLFKENKKLIFSTCFFDNLAWIAFAYSMTYIPIAIATGISESYIALAAGLGFVINKEKLKKHQVLGLVIVVVSTIVLALITEK